ncbi:hypothetical protein ElyMa_001159400 [Elysia marginata]|uniref:Uncharacterized protein n=1 Tax=Elysia marginata TaxID=1093978 RepID=A0AAV4I2S0_9GAST|nr:hypothetical protein ElyMa_001159400 [Elysia marginata]
MDISRTCDVQIETWLRTLLGKESLQILTQQLGTQSPCYGPCSYKTEVFSEAVRVFTRNTLRLVKPWLRQQGRKKEQASLFLAWQTNKHARGITRPGNKQDSPDSGRDACVTWYTKTIKTVSPSKHKNVHILDQKVEEHWADRLDMQAIRRPV